MKDQSYGIIPIIKEGNEFKILHLKHLKGHWGLPKGHPEGDETPIETAKREFWEETGLERLELIDGILFSQTYPVVLNGINYDKTVTYFPAYIDKDEQIVLEKEKLDFAFFTIEDMVALNLPKESQKIIQEIGEFLESGLDI